jgi:putative nucleotidyltransferase with HDIG domain
MSQQRTDAHLKRVAIADLKVGMFVEEICGAWVDHPFWRTRFMVRTPDELERLRASGIKGFWINPKKGLDAPDHAAEAARRAQVEAEVKEKLEAYARSARGTPTPAEALAAELRQAARMLHDSREKVCGMFDAARLGRLTNLEAARGITSQITASVERHPFALLNLARLKRADDYTYMHSVAVAALMTGLARQLGMDSLGVDEAAMAGLLHDVGKARVPLAILNKEGALDEGEWSQMRDHPAVGAAMLETAEGISPAVLDAVRYHHEKYDGSGYLEGLAGEAIPLLARMACTCDVYDAITSDRPYKPGWHPTVAVRKMAEWTGHFDERIFQAFVKTVGIYPLGSLVRLRSQRLAVVVGHDPAHLLQPTVRVFFSLRSQVYIEPETIDLMRDPGERIVSCENPQAHGVHDLEDLWLPAGVAAGARALHEA